MVIFQRDGTKMRVCHKSLLPAYHSHCAFRVPCAIAQWELCVAGIGSSFVFGSKLNIHCPQNFVPLMNNYVYTMCIHTDICFFPVPFLCHKQCLLPLSFLFTLSLSLPSPHYYPTSPPLSPSPSLFPPPLSLSLSLSPSLSQQSRRRTSSPPVFRCDYNVYSTFQSHEPEFDYLKSLEIEEKINQIAWVKPSGSSLFLLTTNGRCGMCTRGSHTEKVAIFFISKRLQKWAAFG